MTTTWPQNMKIGPLREWPGALTPHSSRRVSPFRNGYRTMPLSDTLRVLNREIDELRGTEVELLVAISPEQFRRDGYPRATARAEHPGVVLSFKTKFGMLSYPCDTFTEWPDNLRAIALALEALRKVNRYGVTKHGEQYRGSLAIESGTPAMTRDMAEHTIRQVAGVGVSEPVTRQLVNRALFRSHPDTITPDNTPEDYNRVRAAKDFLNQNGIA